MLPQQPNQQTHGDVSRQTLLSTLDTVVDSLIHSRQALRLPPHAHRTSRVQVEIDGHERILDEHIHFTQLPSEAPDDNHFHILRHMRTTKHVTSRSTTTTTRTHHNNDGRKSVAPPQQQQHQQQGQPPQATNAPNDARNAKADSRRSTSEHQRLLLTHADQQRLLEMIKNAIAPYYQRPAAAAAATSTVPPAMAPSLSGGPSRFERGPHADECHAKQIPVQPDPSCFCGGPNRPSPGADMPNWETEKGRAKARDARVPRQYDRHGAVTAWNRYYEVEANVAIAVKNLLKARTCMRNVHFAVGSLFPASATYTDDIGKMQQQLKAFNTQFRYLNTKVNEKLSAGPRQAAARAAGGPPRRASITIRPSRCRPAT
ncbi:unnamed protein product, partial [Mesorhabditis spiculigera]